MAIPPAVLVRNAEGGPVAGATVQFTVLEGGGSVAGGSATSDAAGVAKVTGWTLGTSGPQRLRAQLGSLPAVEFEATLLPGTEVITVTMPTSGGTHQITTPGHPYQGLTLTVPAGTYPGGGSVQMRAVANATIPDLPAGYSLRGPVLEVYSQQARGINLMTLDVPVTRGPNEAVVIVLHDPVRGVTEVMPSVGWTETSVRVVTTHLRADLLLGPQPSGTFGAAGPQAVFPIGSSAWLARVAVLLPLQPVAPVINTTTERWPVIDHGSAAFPAGHSAAIAALVNLNKALQAPSLTGAVIPVAEPGFYADAAPLAVVIEQQLRVNTMLVDLLDQYHAARLNAVRAVGGGGIHIDLVAGMALSADPVMVALVPSGSGSDPVYVNGVSGSAEAVTVLNPGSSSLATLLSDGTDGYQTVALPRTPDQPLVTVGTAVPLPSFMVDFEAMSGQLVQMHEVLGEVIGSTQREVGNQQMASAAGLGYPDAEMEGSPEGGWVPQVPYEDLVVRAPSARVRLVFSGTAVGDTILVAPWSNPGQGYYTTLDSLFPRDFPGFPSEAASGPTEHYIVFYMAVPFPPGSPFFGRKRQMGSRTIPLAPARFRVTPETVELPGDREVTLEAEVPSPPAGGYRIKWEWGDGEEAENLGLPTATHTYAEAGDYKVIATLMANTDRREVLAVDTATISGAAAPYWRITSIADQDELFDDDFSGGNDITQLLQRVLAVPTSGAITIEQTGGTTELRLRALRTAIWDPDQCCPLPPFNSATELALPLGVTPLVPYAFGPFFAGWGFSSWSQSSEDLSTGSMMGQFVLGTAVYAIKDAGSQAGPAGAVRLTANRADAALTGTISIFIWWINEDTGEVTDPGPEQYRFPFTAIRMK